MRDAGHVLPVSDFNQNRFDRFIFEGDILAPAGNTQSLLELQTKVHEDFTITEKGEGRTLLGLSPDGRHPVSIT